MNDTGPDPSPWFRIRAASPEDALAVDTVRTAGWRHAYRGVVPDAVLDGMTPDPPRRRRQLADPGPGGFDYLAESGGRVIGWVSAGPVRDSDLSTAVQEVYACYVHPDQWGHGVGAALLTTALGTLTGRPGVPEVVLWVLEGNGRARRFYERHGFTPDGTRRLLPPGRVPGDVAEVRYVHATRAPHHGDV
ncbi:ribosomal protein S18 acetylase RimI-like enzyme [Haloactinospora alba]|uniref:Ribosomal protein S18 acetylase RimI-like enzyme n=1 Tax=Haloactinospora alba TaxID=405555 RepID=A0A543NI83_9ACTN|nr:GNAT family N-acetyltransferase [Haloactinospora alba]TQN31548.1 ribosomal protein S18 acetylase RimI-like enzyme [Haloactinospora alba]